MNEEIIKNGFVGTFKEEDVFVYCNEKDFDPRQVRPRKDIRFLFKCGKGCEHNPIEEVKSVEK